MRVGRIVYSFVLAALAIVLVAGSATAAGSGSQGRAIYMRPRIGYATGPSGSGQLAYKGGPVGVETAPHL